MCAYQLSMFAGALLHRRSSDLRLRRCPRRRWRLRRRASKLFQKHHLRPPCSIRPDPIREGPKPCKLGSKIGMSAERCIRTHYHENRTSKMNSACRETAIPHVSAADPSSSGSHSQLATKINGRSVGRSGGVTPYSRFYSNLCPSGTTTFDPSLLSPV